MARPELAELVDLLRRCGSGEPELCDACPYCDLGDCSGTLMLDASDALAAEINPRL